MNFDTTPLPGGATKTKYKVRAIFYGVHTKIGALEDDPKTMLVEYRTGWHRYHCEFICFEHTGWAREKAHRWWRKRSDAPIPVAAAHAVAMAKAGYLCETISVVVHSEVGKKFDRIVDYELGEKPKYSDPIWDEDEPFEPDLETAAIEDGEVPF